MALNFTINDGFEDTPMPPELISIVASFVTNQLFNDIRTRVAYKYVCRLLLPLAKHYARANISWPKTFELVRNGFTDCTGCWYMINPIAAGRGRQRLSTSHEIYPRDISDIISRLWLGYGDGYT